MLIHGCGASKYAFVDIPLPKYFKCSAYAYSLDTKKYACVTVFENNKTIDEYVIQAQQHLNMIKHTAENVIIIGHSMGGLIGLQLAYMNPSVISHVIMFGTPIKGAPLLQHWVVSKVLNAKQHRQMTPKSQWLNDLHNLFHINNTNVPCNFNINKVLAIASENDFHVPISHASYPGMKTIVISGYGHSSMILNRCAWKEIRKFIDT